MPASPSGPSTEPASPVRYAYLVGRLRNRQITMEEATELFGLMQGMLRDAELVRARLAQAPPPGPAKPARELAAAPSPVAMSDDLVLLGLLALGAGAGLGAAFARRLGGSQPAAQGVAAPPNARTKQR